MKVGTFINYEKLKGFELFFDSRQSVFYMEGNGTKTVLSQSQVIALSQQNVIQWEDPDIIKALMASQNRVADAPFKNIDLPDVNEGVVPQTAQDPRKKLLVLLLPIIVIFLIVGGISLLLKNVTPAGGNKTPTVNVEAESAKIKNYFLEIQKEIKGKKSFVLYEENVNHQKIMTTLSQTYASAYLELYPKTNEKIIKNMPGVYTKAYDAMIQRQLKNNSLKGTALDGEIQKITMKSGDTFIATIKTVAGKTLELQILKKGSSYYINDIINGIEFNKQIIKNK